jgi:hypothetical protein
MIFLPARSLDRFVFFRRRQMAVHPALTFSGVMDGCRDGRMIRYDRSTQPGV